MLSDFKLHSICLVNSTKCKTKLDASLLAEDGAVALTLFSPNPFLVLWFSKPWLFYLCLCCFVESALCVAVSIVPAPRHL